MSKIEQYEALYKSAASILEGESDIIAKQANLVALIHEQFQFWWIGFYRVLGEELVLGPFQGPVACMRITKGRGVCGTAWQNAQTIVVPDVETFPGHIACSAASKSEIVVPVKNADGLVSMVLDIDSDKLNAFDDIDRQQLERIVQLLDN